MKESELCRHLLGVEAPWDVCRIRIDTYAKELHAYLSTTKSGWFGRYLPDKPRARWRHTNVGGYRTFIHADLSEAPAYPTPPAFIGAPGNDFTQGLAHNVIRCLQAGLRYREVCELLEIDIHLAWQIKHAISGIESGGGAMALDEADAQSGIPPSHHPIWTRLLESSDVCQIRLLSLKLLLSRARQDFSRLSDDEVKAIKINEVRRFFIKHEKQLTSEIAQLNAACQQGDGR